MSENITVSPLLKRSKVHEHKCDLKSILGNSFNFWPFSHVMLIRATAQVIEQLLKALWAGNSIHVQGSRAQLASPTEVITETFWSGNQTMRVWRGSFTHSFFSYMELDISLCDTKSRVYLLFNFSSQFIFQLINPFPSNLSPLSILTGNSSLSSCWEASIFQSSQALIPSCLAWAASILFFSVLKIQDLFSD